MTVPSRADEAQRLLAAAELDRVTFTILARDAQAPAEIALFLAQQALEKGIKAVLAARGVVFRRTHDLIASDGTDSRARKRSSRCQTVGSDELIRAASMPWHQQRVFMPVEQAGKVAAEGHQLGGVAAGAESR